MTAFANLITSAQALVQYLDDATPNADDPIWDDMSRCYEAIAALSSSPAAPGWIACSERMPEIPSGCIGSVNVLLYCDDDWIRMGNWQGDSWGLYGSANIRERQDITHWHPLPSPPPSLPGDKL